MAHRIWLCEAPRSRAIACWATLRPETPATTATKAAHTAAMTSRRRFGSVMVAWPGAVWGRAGSGARVTLDMMLSAPFGGNETGGVGVGERTSRLVLLRY